MTSGRFPVRRGADAGRIVAIFDENESVAISSWKPTRAIDPARVRATAPPFLVHFARADQAIPVPGMVGTGDHSIL